MQQKTPLALNQDTAETIALQALGYLISEDDLRDRFLALSGLTATNIRENIDKEGFLAGVLGFFAEHEPDLLLLAEKLGQTPETVAAAWEILRGPEFDPNSF